VPREGRFRLLHLATHAVFREDNPLFSGLQLSDGWLLAADIERRRLECDLVTLSACTTGLGALAPGEEVLGLTRSFLRAGARSVLVSLWAAHDGATALLMRAFYKRLNSGLRRGEALRGARSEVRERYQHPYFWAPFTLVGAS
jgi:CHAT domain-containing protein